MFNELNSCTHAFNEAALAAARQLDASIPEGALPIVFMSAVEVYPDLIELADELAETLDTASPYELVAELNGKQKVMWLPKGYEGLGFAAVEGEQVGPAEWFVVLEITGLPHPRNVEPTP